MCGADDGYSGPDLKALRRILFALIASAVLCFAIALTLIARTKRPNMPMRTASPARCACGGQCVRAPMRTTP
jgi:hypothetical protein